MGKAAQIQILRDFEPEIIAKCWELDKKVYKAEYVSSLDHEGLIIKRNPRSRVVVWYQGDLIAYYEYLPFTPAAFEIFLNCKDQVFDLTFEADYISPWLKDQPVDVYVSSIVVSPDHQGKMISMVLMRGLLMALRELENEGYQLGRMGGTGVSSGGVYSLKTYLDMAVLFEVPGGTAMAGTCQDAIARLDEYVGF